MARNRKSAEHGFSEEPSSFNFDAPKEEQKWRLTVGKDGRVVIPAEAREQMLLGSSGVVMARIVDGELRLLSLLAGIRRIQAISAKYKKPGESVVDEFIAERRAEAAREND